MARESPRFLRRLIGGAIATAVVLAVALSFSCARRPGAPTHVPSEAILPHWEPRPARVLLVERAPSATLAAAERYTVTRGDVPSGADASPLDQGLQLAESVVRATPGGLAIGARQFPHAALLVAAAADGTLSVNGSRYRGEVLIRRVAPDQIAILNLIPVERYLYGVLGGETYANWPEAALEAQAIIARTYALWRIAERRGEPCDLVASVADQNYLGAAKETPRLRAAVDRTEGRVLLYQMKLFRCYYHSTCGGHTEAVENVFPDPPLAPLSSVACAYCKGSPHYRWQCQITKSEIAEALRRSGLAFAGLASIEVATRTPAGRALDLTVEPSEGAKLTMRAGDFRLRIGPRKLPSTFFEVRDLGASYEFRGRGWGHGVGLCQWGSKGMAEMGHSAQSILGRYYPGAVLHRLYRGHDYVEGGAAPARAAAGGGSAR